MIVGVCKLLLAIPGARSLKEKRSVLRKVLDRTGHKFQLSVVETDFQDKWQRAEIGFALVGIKYPHVEAKIERIVTFIDELFVASIVDVQSDVYNFS